MATFTASIPLTLVFRPSIAPWVGESCEIALPRDGGAARDILAGQPCPVPDSLVFAADRQLRASGLVPGFTWTETPSPEVIATQRAQAEAYAPDSPRGRGKYFPEFGE